VDLTEFEQEKVNEAEAKLRYNILFADIKATRQYVMFMSYLKAGFNEMQALMLCRE